MITQSLHELSHRQHGASSLRPMRAAMPITATDPSSTSCELPPQQRATPVRLTRRRWSTFCGVCRRQPRAVRILVSPIAARYLLPQRRARPAAAMDRLQLANRAIPLQWCRGDHLPDAAPAQCSTDAVLEVGGLLRCSPRALPERPRLAAGSRPQSGQPVAPRLWSMQRCSANVRRLGATQRAYSRTDAR